MKKDEFIEKYGIEAYQRRLEQSRKWKEEHPEYYKEYHRKYYQDNQEKLKEKTRKWEKENSEKAKEYHRKYYQENKEKEKERVRQWYNDNIDKVKEYHRKYYQDNQEKLKERARQWEKENSEKAKEYQRKWREDNLDKKKEMDKEYRQTPMGRANHLVNGYKREDKKYNRGECTLTPDWIVEHIFNSQCVYCGETDWLKLGCDRIDNSLPHTPDNVVCSCAKCNRERQKKSFNEFLECKIREREKCA